MSYHTKIIKIVRGLINDLGSPPTYSDADIQSISMVAAVYVIMELDFDVAYAIDVEAETISPDPSNDLDFLGLTCLKSACLIFQGDHRIASDKAMAVRDGPSSIDTRSMADNKRLLVQDILKKYEQAKFDYCFGDGAIGQAIVGPYNFDDIYIGH